MDLSNIGPHTAQVAVLLPLLVQFGKTQLGLKGKPVALLSLAMGSALGALSLQGEAGHVFSAPGVPPALLGALWGVIVAAIVSGIKDLASAGADRLRAKNEADAAPDLGTPGKDTVTPGALHDAAASALAVGTASNAGVQAHTAAMDDLEWALRLDAAGRVNAREVGAHAPLPGWKPSPVGPLPASAKVQPAVTIKRPYTADVPATRADLEALATAPGAQP